MKNQADEGLGPQPKAGDSSRRSWLCRSASAPSQQACEPVQDRCSGPCSRPRHAAAWRSRNRAPAGWVAWATNAITEGREPSHPSSAPAGHLLPRAAIFPVRLIGLLDGITWLSSARSATSSLVDYGVSTDIDLRTFDDGWSAENAAHTRCNKLHDKRL